MVTRALAEKEKQNKLSTCDNITQELVAALWGPLCEIDALVEHLHGLIFKVFS